MQSDRERDKNSNGKRYGTVRYGTVRYGVVDKFGAPTVIVIVKRHLFTMESPILSRFSDFTASFGYRPWSKETLKGGKMAKESFTIKIFI